MHILGTHTERRLLWRGRDIPLIQKRGVDPHFVLSQMSRRRWRGRLLGRVVRGGKRHWWVWGIP
jgi:hypothetical protein